MSGRCKYSNAATRFVNIAASEESIFSLLSTLRLLAATAAFRLGVCKFKRARRDVRRLSLSRAVCPRSRDDTRHFIFRRANEILPSSTLEHAAWPAFLLSFSLALPKKIGSSHYLAGRSFYPPLSSRYFFFPVYAQHWLHDAFSDAPRPPRARKSPIEATVGRLDSPRYNFVCTRAPLLPLSLPPSHMHLSSHDPDASS